MSTLRLPAGASCLQPSKALRILVAEDDEIQQKILTHVLAPLHFELAIILSAHASARQRATALDAGADAHAAKPINPETLIIEILQFAQQGRE